MFRAMATRLIHALRHPRFQLPSLTNLDGAGDDRTADITASGWTGGIGAEIALNDRLSVKGEYLESRLK
jgi:opacity protein-like surface antigen